MTFLTPRTVYRFFWAFLFVVSSFLRSFISPQNVVAKKTENYYSFWLRAVDQADSCQLPGARYYQFVVS